MMERFDDIARMIEDFWLPVLSPLVLLFLLFLVRPQEIKIPQPIIPCSSPFLLYCLGPSLVLQTTMSLGILRYRHQKWFCSELPLHPKQ